MSSYPILDNRPIDQWRVVELKEELKRRKLTTRGLKEDLVKRLDEALRIEREIAQKEKEQQADYGAAVDHMHKVIDKGKVVTPIASESAPILDNVCIANEKADDARVEVDVNYSLGALDSILVGEVAESDHSESVAELSPVVASVETTHTEGVAKLSPAVASLEFISVVSVSSERPAMPSEHGAEIVEAQGNCSSEVQQDMEDVEVIHKDVILDSSAPINQVSEANIDLGFQVRSAYISTDSVSINEKNEYKDNIIADNIKLELDVLKPEIGVEPSSSSVDPVSGESHPLDVVEPHEDKVAAEVKEEKDAVTADINKNNENVDTGDSEKLNLDRSSSYESMEEDVLDSKHFDSKPIGGGVKEESAQVEENLVDIVGDADVKDIDVDKDHTSILTEKRKLYGNETDGPAKRQRKWKSEGLQEVEPKVVSVASTLPKDIPQMSNVKRNFSSMSDSVGDGSPKERIVPPSQKPATDSLRIDQFLRPFTLKAVQELLGKTGSITRFWMDHIKTHCYVTYSSVEEAVETRNAIYNLQWPPNGGRLLVAEFVDPQEVKARIDGPPLTAAPALAPAAPAPKPMIPVSSSPTGAVKAVSQPRQPVPRQLQPQQRPPPPPLLHSPLLPPPPPLILEKADPTIVTLDVLFKKTTATPRIYYLPLSEEQVAAKLALCGKTVR